MAAPRTRRRILAGAVALLAVVTILLATGGVGSGLRAIGRGITAPFVYVFNEIAHPIADLFGGVVNYSSVLQQNKELRAALALANEQAVENEAAQSELAQVSAAQHLPFAPAIARTVAQVTADSPTNFSATITIDKGTSSGVLVGMPVVGAGGLLGRVIAVSSSGATVQLVTDPTSIVGVTFGRGTIDTLVYGRGVNSDLTASAVPSATPLAPGTLLYTSGLRGGEYPPGLPVARIETVALTPGSSDYNLALNPTADFSNLSYVDVLLWEPST